MSGEVPFLEARGIHTYYGVSHVLQGVDLVVRGGETLGLMGRNGMGKTTLLKSVVGLLRPRAGAVRIKGEDMTRAAPHRIARAGVAYVPEGRGIFPNLTVRENLVMAARPGANGRREWTLERILDTFPPLRERQRLGGGALSGGEQQMLTIGRALMTNPDLLILDEATEGLAPRVSREIWTIIASVKAGGIATVIVDKNFRAVTSIADRVQILVKGSTVYDGSAQQLQTQPELHLRYLGI
jgi:branched-chain amino acid transport system ATP-binding protein